MATPNLWSKLEDAGDVTSPDLGTGGAEVGSPTYEAAKFNNGILSDVNSEGCTFPTAANSINLNKGTIEFWGKMKFNQTHADYHYLFDFRLAADGGIAVFFDPANDDFQVRVRSGGTTRVQIVTVGLSWNVDDLLHFGLTWDREGNDIGDGKTVALYVDNVEGVSSSTGWNADTINTNLFLGTLFNGTLHSDVVIDNLKTYDTCKIDFSDKDTEGVGPITQAVTGTLAFADAISKKIKRVLSDNLSFTDSVSTGARFKKALADTLAFADGIIKKTSRLLTDNLAFTDAIIKKLSRLLTDTIAFTDATTSKFIKIFRDGIGFVDKIVKWCKKGKPTATWTERTKPTDTATERADTGGPGYSFSMANIFWDRTDIYFNSTTTGPTQRTKPTDSATERTKPTNTWTERNK